MTYIVANTRNEGKKWAKLYLGSEEKYEILSTRNQIVGRAFMHTDCIYIITSNMDIIKVLMPALVGASVFSHNSWISDRWKEFFNKKRK